MYRTHTCGELNLRHAGQTVTLAGWVQRSRDLGGMTFIDLRDRYGITQLAFNMETNADLCSQARKLGREYVVQVVGRVIERSSKNSKIPTGDIEIEVQELCLLNESRTPPFTIEDQSDGGDDLRMRYRYLDIRRNPVRQNLEMRHRMAMLVRNYLSDRDFLEIETPMLIKSTPEGARDFVVPSRMNPGEFYALPQSPQQYKQLLMVAGMDRYFQIVRCFRDEDLRADRQPEFTQIDCEMSFAHQEDVLDMFEGLAKHLFTEMKGLQFDSFPRMTWHDAMRLYGSDKPDIRFGMQFVELNEVVKGKGFGLFDAADLVVGICAKGCAEYSRKQLDALTDFVKRPQVGAGGLVYIKYNLDGSFKSSVDKFYTADDLRRVAACFGAAPGDLMLVLCGPAMRTRVQLCALRLEMAQQMGLRTPDVYAPLWVVDFPLLEWDEETQRYYAMHHPFTAPKPEDEPLLADPTRWGDIRANAYDMVINGVEVGGGSIRIHDRTLQNQMFHTLGFSDEQAYAQFGFLMDAFTYGAPPHAGLAFGFDRLCSLFGGVDTIRDFIAFPKNNSGRDVMSGSPSPISQEQLDELQIRLDKKN
ncbi:MAG: aspartyl-tRNA synthetase [bacterium P3]|nr:MAG: aspartyl-tRNA synthetase [bacterium P201]KWW30503.1 MAG: aspartyl-tRNA synthetase [bacterium P3]KWW41390.1 MAG: aspartyl-tRNA synthetase [bacterium F083]